MDKTWIHDCTPKSNRELARVDGDWRKLFEVEMEKSGLTRTPVICKDFDTLALFRNHMSTVFAYMCQTGNLLSNMIYRFTS